MHDIFAFGALIISLDAKMLLAQWQDLIYFLFSENNRILPITRGGKFFPVS